MLNSIYWTSFRNIKDCKNRLNCEWCSQYPNGSIARDFDKYCTYTGKCFDYLIKKTKTPSPVTTKSEPTSNIVIPVVISVLVLIIIIVVVVTCAKRNHSESSNTDTVPNVLSQNPDVVSIESPGKKYIRRGHLCSQKHI